MMLPIAAFGLIGLFLVYYLVSSFINKRRHVKQERQFGCQAPLRRQAKWPLGIDLVKAIADADKQERVPEFLLDVRNQLGVDTWVQDVLGTDMLVTMEPKNIQAILATQFNDFELGEQRRGVFGPLLGNGIFTADGKAWEHARAMLRPQFARGQVADLEAEEHHVQDLMRHLESGVSGWTNTVDLSPIFFRLTLDSATEFLFGQSVNSQLAALPGYEVSKQAGDLDWTAFGPAFDHCTMELAYRIRLNDMFWLRNTRAFRENCKKVHKFADYYVGLALREHDLAAAEKQSINSEKPSKYVFLRELVESTQDPIELRSQLMNILVAGRDTTAGLLGWTFYLLARHPDVYARLRREILENFGSYEKPRNITFADLKSCSLLQWTMNETLRLYPMVPFNSRRAVKDTTLPLGGGPDGKAPLYVRKGTEINYSVHIMHHRKDLWGPDVDEFKPDRWQSRKSGWEYLPFNGGPRICLGQQHALTLAGFTIVRLLQRFDRIENMDTDPYPRHHYSITTSPAHCSVRLHEATA